MITYLLLTALLRRLLSWLFDTEVSAAFAAFEKAMAQ